jgi:hypothetical protein
MTFASAFIGAALAVGIGLPVAETASAGVLWNNGPAIGNAAYCDCNATVGPSLPIGQ